VDTIHNDGDRMVCIEAVAARFALTPGCYEAHTQDSQWGTENVMCRRILGPEALELSCRGGRTAERSTPYLCLSERESQQAVAFHLIPQGNWCIRVIPSAAVGQLVPQRVVELGPKDVDLTFALSPNQAWTLPEILVQSLPGMHPEGGAPRLHQYLLATESCRRRRDLPFVYNTWGDATDTLDLGRLRIQLTAAAEAGCEVFVVDAGWYGLGPEGWFDRVGDWRERTPEAFAGELSDFADEVRSAGLGFGLWMEPERFGASVPVVKEHPEWFLPTPTGHFFADLRQGQVFDWLKQEISGVIDRYGPVWLKFDTNTEFGNDGTELALYFQRWDRLMAELRSEHPEIVFEGCASGGLRSEIGATRRFDCNHTSDSQNPMDVIRITSAGLLRLPAGNATNWIVLKPGGSESPTTHGPIITGREMEIDVGFAAATALLGVAGFGGNLAGLAPDSVRKVKAGIALYKRFRNGMRESVAHLLTPLQDGQELPGWTAIQFELSAGEGSLLFVFRMDTIGKRWIRLRSLDPAKRYLLKELTGAVAEEEQEASGGELMQAGFGVRLPRSLSAQIWHVSTI
jgi:alpha-galactosidase